MLAGYVSELVALTFSGLIWPHSPLPSQGEYPFRDVNAASRSCPAEIAAESHINLPRSGRQRRMDLSPRNLLTREDHFLLGNKCSCAQYKERPLKATTNSKFCRSNILP